MGRHKNPGDWRGVLIFFVFLSSFLFVVQVEEIEVAQRDELHSLAMLRLFADNENDLEHTLELMRSFVKSSAPIAECTMTEIK